MKTQDLSTKIITKKLKDVRNCESWASPAVDGVNGVGIVRLRFCFAFAKILAQDDAPGFLQAL